MPEYAHGGDIYSYQEKYGRVPIDFSSNINPLGLQKAVLAALCEAAIHADRYPDARCTRLIQTLAEFEQIPQDWILCGNGAADLIYRTVYARRPKRALLLSPTFSEYEAALRAVKCRVQFYRLKEETGFVLTPDFLKELDCGYDMIFLCNPNNPTGRTIAPALLREITARCAQVGARLVVDECFLDFVPGGETLVPYLDEFPSLVLLRAYTKMYAVPGVRFGWCMTADTALIEGLYRAGQPWNVSVIAQACAAACAQESAFAHESATRIADERAYLSAQLVARGLWVCPGEANFLLFRAQDVDLQEKLARRGILVRDCSNYRGLARGYYRTAVKMRKESDALLAALDEIQKEES